MKRALRDYVCVLVDDLTGVDIALYDFDSQVTFFLFVMTAEEQILTRYGGSDDASEETYLSEKSLLLALEKGVELNKQALAGELKFPERPKARYPRDIAEIKNNALKKKQCVHCHMIAHGDVIAKQNAGKLDRKRDLWFYPDIKTLGIFLDVDKGLEVKKSDGAAKIAGLKRGDLITSVDGIAVYTFADLQYRIHKAPIDAKSVALGIERKGEAQTLTVELFEHWRVTKIGRRSSTHALKPFPGFWGKELTDKERRQHRIDDDEMGCVVTKFWVNTRGKQAGMKVGDVVYEIDGVKKSPLTLHPPTWIRLNCDTGQEITVKVIRGTKRLTFKYKLKARPW